MRARGGCPAGVPCFIVTSLPDAQAAARLYCDLFGWTAEEQMPADAPATTSRRSSTAANVAGISSQPSGAPANAVWSTYIAVDDADDAADGSAPPAAACCPRRSTSSTRDGWPSAPIRKARFSLWQAGRHTGAHVVNAQGSCNWSDLHTRGVGAAPHWAVTFAVDGTDATADRAAALGAPILAAPCEAGPTRIATLRDPQGATFSISTYTPRG